MALGTKRKHQSQSKKLKLVSHRIQRLKDEHSGVVHVTFFVQDDSGNHHLAVVGTDARGSGHFTYVSVPDLSDALGFEPEKLRSSNRGGVMEWLDKIGAKAAATDNNTMLPEVDLSQFTPASVTAGDHEPAPKKVAKRKSAAKAAEQHDYAAGVHLLAAEAELDPLAGGDNVEAGCLQPTKEAREAFETADPQLLQWVCDTPEAAAIEEFQRAKETLSGVPWGNHNTVPLNSEGKASSGPAPTVADAITTLDKLAGYGKASLQLLEVSNISPEVGRLRRHPNREVATKAEAIASCWHAMAAATSQHAQQHLKAQYC